uniref:Uncharacterized protein n=1 Tax=Picea sitchensis TaxID=3332 RepID=A0A6B9XPD9_PICSI|nr:hypothetical protein Q903MT_gene3812 [Picea sitchensis]
MKKKAYPTWFGDLSLTAVCLPMDRGLMARSHLLDRDATYLGSRIDRKDLGCLSDSESISRVTNMKVSFFLLFEIIQ